MTPTPLTPAEHLAALADSLTNLTTELDAARADVASARADLASAQAEVDRLTLALANAQATPGFVNAAEITRLTDALADARVAAAHAEATAQAYEQRIDALNERLSDAEDDIDATRVLVDTERTRREAVAQELANVRVDAANQHGDNRVEAANLRGENNLVVERSRQRWAWWSVLLVALLACLVGYLLCTFCGSCCKGKKMVPVEVVEPKPVVMTVPTVDPVVVPQPLAPEPAVVGDRTITFGTIQSGPPQLINGCTTQHQITF